MIVKHNRRIALWAGLLAFVMAMVGCGASTEYPEPLPFSTDMPPTLEESVSRQVGFDAQLYFISQDGRMLFPEERLVESTLNKSRAEAVILALFKGPVSEALQASVPEGLSLQSVEVSMDVCNIYLTGGAFPGRRPWVTLRAALAATVCAVEEVSAVNVYFNGMEPGYLGRPLGALRPIEDALDVYLNNLKQEYEVLASQPNTEAGSFETHTASLCFLDVTGSLLLARTTDINYARNATKSQVAELLILKLLEGDAGPDSLEPVLPADLRLVRPPEFIYERGVAPQDNAADAAAGSSGDEKETIPSGGDADVDLDEEAYVVVTIQRPVQSYDEKLMCGALTRTICGYIPKVKGVCIVVQDADGSLTQLGDTWEAEVGDTLKSDGRRYFTARSFSSLIGEKVYLSFPDSDGTALYHVGRAVPCVAAYDPRVRLAELFVGPADPGVLYPAFSAEDIRSVYIVGDIAVVDWAAGFRNQFMQTLQADATTIPVERRELLFVYSVVNTLTEFPGVQRVWMMENGEKLGMLEQIYLGGALLRSPGILVGADG